MTRQEKLQIIEKVAAGLRRMDEQPDYFLECDSDLEYDGLEICGIPIIYSAFISNTMTDSDVPFIPVWKESCGAWIFEREKFNRGYDEY